MWIYDRPHLKNLPEKKRVLYSLGLGSIFVGGSLLMSALAKNLSSDAITRTVPRMILGASLGGGCIHLGKSYMDIVDGESDEDEEEKEEEEEEVEVEGHPLIARM